MWGHMTEFFERQFTSSSTLPLMRGHTSPLRHTTTRGTTRAPAVHRLRLRAVTGCLTVQVKPERIAQHVTGPGRRPRARARLDQILALRRVAPRQILVRGAIRRACRVCTTRSAGGLSTSDMVYTSVYYWLTKHVIPAHMP